MNVSAVIKAGGGWYAVLLPLILALILIGGHGFVSGLEFVLGALNSFGAA